MKQLLNFHCRHFNEDDSLGILNDQFSELSETEEDIDYDNYKGIYHEEESSEKYQ